MMSAQLAIILPCLNALDFGTDSGTDFGALFWCLIEEGGMRARGQDSRWLSLHREDGIPITAFVPVSEMSLRWFSYPNLAPLQAAAVARANLMESSLESADVLHIISGFIAPPIAPPITGDAKQAGIVAAGLVRHSAMADWMQWLERCAVQPQALVPLALLLPPSAEDVALRAYWAGESIVCAGGVTHVADPMIDSFLIGDRAVETVDMVAATGLSVRLPPIVATPALDLLVGPWRIHRRFFSSPRKQYWLIGLVFAALLLALALYMATAMGMALAAFQGERRALAAAQAVGVTADTMVAAETLLTQRLQAQAAGALSLSAMLAGVYPTLAAHRNGVIDYLTYSADGSLRIRFSTRHERDLTALLAALRARGYWVYAEDAGYRGSQAIAMIEIRVVPR